MPTSVDAWLRDHRGQATLLGICPTSEEVVRAAIAEAAAKDFVPMFVATPRQVDADRGYTGWSQSELSGFVDSVCMEYEHSGPYLLARDHGGPYQSFRDRNDPGVELKEAMTYAKELFAADLEADFDILHIDATEDPRVDGPLEIDEIARRTADLIDYIESERGPADDGTYYEVGTEEIVGGMTEPSDFEAFINGLFNRLGDASERVIFAVGQVGTTMRIDMTNEFDSDQAGTLVDIAADYDVSVKVHYTDWLPASALERLPELGVGAANVGPEFSAAATEALLDLAERERDLVGGAASGFDTTIERVAVAEAPWETYAPPELDDDELKAFGAEHSREIALCVGRYVLGHPEVVAARERLTENLQDTGIDPDEEVVEAVRETIDRYVQAFDLAETR